MSREGSEILGDERNFCKGIVVKTRGKVYDQELGELDLFEEAISSIVKVFLSQNISMILLKLLLI